MIKIIFVFLIVLFGCESITSLIDNDNYYHEIDADSGKENLSIIFSHNINGELEPCGCRHHPLGGISQLAGFFKFNSQKNINFYIDIGDTFFANSKIPNSLEKSFKYSANSLAKNLSNLGLKYMVPGDQDFAAGINFLDELGKKNKISFLISNLKNNIKLKHQKIGKLKVFNKEFIFIGLVSPDLMNQNKSLFEDPFVVFQNLMKENPSFKDKNVMVLSHMGMDQDIRLAKKFPFIKWIIGAHSQSFLKEAQVVGSTRIVQVLSRNHYLGKINIPVNPKAETQYELVEMRQKWEKELTPNPYIEAVQLYRTELNKIQKSEQENLMVYQNDKTVYKLSTASSCIECHKEQGKFWQKTAHALAYQTLRKKKAELNPSCVGCHSLGYQQENGFIAATDIVQFKKKEGKVLDQYLKELDSIFKNQKSIRDLTKKQRIKLSQKWLKLDQKHQVSHNFANVQCLNCHDKSIDHPFEDSEAEKGAGKVDTNRCLNCHTSDQSPKWYKNSDRTKVDGRILNSMLSNIACPKMKP